MPEFGHDQPLRTLAGSWFHGGSPFGDPDGPYMGANLGSSADPVQLHIASRTDTDRTMPTTLVFTGRSGGGKSTAVELTLAGLLAEGAWALLVDNKGDLAGIVDMARRILGVTVQEIDVLDPAVRRDDGPDAVRPRRGRGPHPHPGRLLGALSADDRRRGETVLEAAIDQVLQPAPADLVQPRRHHRPARHPGRTTPTPRSRTRSRRRCGCGRKPRNSARSSGTCDAKARPLMTGRGLVYLRLDGLDLPRHTPDPAQWSVAQRCSMATMRIAFSYALLQSRRARAMVKVVALTELHLLTAYPEGRAFVDWLARVGRALKTYLLLDSQSARDLADMVALLEQILMAFCFQATGTTEQNAQAVLLGRPDPGPRLRAAMADLQVGQCVAPGPAPAAHRDGVRPAHPVDRRHPVHRRRRRHPRHRHPHERQPTPTPTTAPTEMPATDDGCRRVRAVRGGPMTGITRCLTRCGDSVAVAAGRVSRAVLVRCWRVAGWVLAMPAPAGAAAGAGVAARVCSRSGAAGMAHADGLFSHPTYTDTQQTLFEAHGPFAYSLTIQPDDDAAVRVGVDGGAVPDRRGHLQSAAVDRAAPPVRGVPAAGVVPEPDVLPGLRRPDRRRRPGSGGSGVLAADLRDRRRRRRRHLHPVAQRGPRLAVRHRLGDRRRHPGHRVRHPTVADHAAGRRAARTTRREGHHRHHHRPHPRHPVRHRVPEPRADRARAGGRRAEPGRRAVGLLRVHPLVPGAVPRTGHLQDRRGAQTRRRRHLETVGDTPWPTTGRSPSSAPGRTGSEAWTSAASGTC